MSLITEAMKKSQRESDGIEQGYAAKVPTSHVSSKGTGKKWLINIAVVLLCLVVCAGMLAFWAVYFKALIEKKQGTVQSKAEATQLAAAEKDVPSEDVPDVLADLPEEPALDSSEPASLPEVDATPAREQALEDSSNKEETMSLPESSSPAAVPETRVEMDESQLPSVEQQEEFRLNGIMNSPRGGLAIINGKVLSKGFRINAAKITEINVDERYVVLQREGKSFRIDMN